MLDDAYSLKNLELAWKWIKSNPDRNYKQFFRSAYQKHELIRDDFLLDLHNDLTNGTYEPSHACKVYLPKKSGVLRPYSLLTVRDQIVYQAFANMIAESLVKKTGGDYNKKIFGHLYAGKASVWFYKRWSKGYSNFNKNAVKAYDSGQEYGASFDLTACYDSIDHGVLSHYLKQLGFEEEFCNALCKNLSCWTVTKYDEPIYQGHGIPQGPLSSGLISEVVLHSFDNEGRKRDVTYLRYVDDIRLFSKSDTSIRSQLVHLDRVSKKIGLFPQSSKIKIHKITDIEAELKSVSRPIEVDVWSPKKQKEIRKEIALSSPRFIVVDVTGFKFSVALCRPCSEVTKRLWRIYEKDPSIYNTLCNYLKKHQSLPEVSFIKVIEEIKKKNPYDVVKAEFISVLDVLSLDSNQTKEAVSTVKYSVYKGGKSLYSDADVFLSSVATKFLIKHNALTSRQLDFAAHAPYWFTRLSLAEALVTNTSSLLLDSRNFLLKDKCLDIALTTAELSFRNQIQINSRLKCDPLIATYMSSYAVSVNTVVECKIDRVLRRMFSLQDAFPSVNWTNLISGEYPHGLTCIVSCSSAYTTNPGAWLNELDTFNEIVVRGIFFADPSIGNFGASYGSVFSGGKNTRFYKKYQTIFKELDEIHSRRVTSMTSHAYAKDGSKSTPFRYREKPEYAQKMLNALMSLATHFPI
jgi:hypothetical protein